MSTLQLQNFGPLLEIGPVLILVATILVLMLGDVAARLARKRYGLGLMPSLVITLAGVLLAAANALVLWFRLSLEGDLAAHGMFFTQGPTVKMPTSDPAAPAWSGSTLVVDHFSLAVCLLVCAITFVTCLLLLPYIKRRRVFQAELYPLLIGSATGMMLLGMSRDLLITFIAIEIVSLPLYVLCGLNHRNLLSRESSLKYFLLGAFASGFFIYGAALIYGEVGQLSYAAIAFYTDQVVAPDGLLLIGLALVGVGFAFKLALAPFHAWVPDVYQGAPSPITGFMATGVKLAVFAAALRFVSEALVWIDPYTWRQGLILFAVISMFVGNLFALHQMSAKRLLAYSAIAHTGYLAAGLAVGNELAARAMLVYLAGYCVAALGAFALISHYAPKGEDDLYLDELNEFSQRAPLPALALAILILSMAGFPLTLGFIGKLVVFTEAWRAGLTGLVIVAVLNSVIGVYYYLRFVLAMYMQPSVPGASLLKVRALPATYSFTIALATVLTLALGVMPGVLVDWFSRIGFGR